MGYAMDEMSRNTSSFLMTNHLFCSEIIYITDLSSSKIKTPTWIFAVKVFPEDRTLITDGQKLVLPSPN